MINDSHPIIEKRQPSLELRGYVDFYLILEVSMSDIPFLYSPATNRNIMVLRFDDDNRAMKFDNQSQVLCNDISLTGLSDRVYSIKTNAKYLKVILIQFKPFGASSLFKVNGKTFLNDNKSLEDFIPSSKKMDLKDRLSSVKTVTEKVNHVDVFLIQFLPHRYHKQRLSTIESCLYLMNMQPEISIRDLCHTIQVSEQHLRRLFHQHIGINPKRYLQINRFSKVFSKTIRGEKSLQHPYHDDPHLIKEFRQFTGFTPTSYPEGLISTEHLLESVPFTSTV